MRELARALPSNEKTVSCASMHSGPSPVNRSLKSLKRTVVPYQYPGARIRRSSWRAGDGRTSAMMNATGAPELHSNTEFTWTSARETSRLSRCTAPDSAPIMRRPERSAPSYRISSTSSITCGEASSLRASPARSAPGCGSFFQKRGKPVHATSTRSRAGASLSCFISMPFVPHSRPRTGTRVSPLVPDHSREHSGPPDDPSRRNARLRAPQPSQCIHVRQDFHTSESPSRG